MGHGPAGPSPRPDADGGDDGGRAAATPEAVLEALRDVIAPEIGVSVVDLGLVCEVSVRDGHGRLRMTMPTPLGPLGRHLAGEAGAAIRRHLPDVPSLRVGLGTEPPRHPGLMSQGWPGGRQWGGLLSAAAILACVAVVGTGLRRPAAG